MKALWALLVGVVLLGVAALVWPASDRDGVRADRALAKSDGTEAPRGTVAPPPESKPKAASADTPALASASSPASSSAQTRGAAAALSAAPATTENRSAPLKATASAPAPASPAPVSGGLALGMDKTIANARVVAGVIVRQKDGSMLADGKYRVEGEGTRESPYRVSWDLLASAGRTYIPRLKEDRIPQWVAMLDGAWVRIDGYVAFPLMLQESAEVLVMLNQWDGCCIGVPPTPYDAIEAKLSEAVKPAKRHTFNFGSVSGRLRVDPLLVENWLVGLYRLEDATLSQEGL